MALAQAATRIDERIKKGAQKVCEQEGTDLSAAMRIFITQIYNDRVIPLNFKRRPTRSVSQIEAEERLAETISLMYKDSVPFDPQNKQEWEK